MFIGGAGLFSLCLSVFHTEEEPGVYLQRVLFPVLLPGLEAMLRQAKETEVLLMPVHIATSPVLCY